MTELEKLVVRSIQKYGCECKGRGVIGQEFLSWELKISEMHGMVIIEHGNKYLGVIDNSVWREYRPKTLEQTYISELMDKLGEIE